MGEGIFYTLLYHCCINICFVFLCTTNIVWSKVIGSKVTLLLLAKVFLLSCFVSKASVVFEIKEASIQIFLSSKKRIPQNWDSCSKWLKIVLPVAIVRSDLSVRLWRCWVSYFGLDLLRTSIMLVQLPVLIGMWLYYTVLLLQTIQKHLTVCEEF